MNNWLRNIQGQLSDLATEVLQEATVEVEDPESELQVEKKKCAEAERQLVIERSNAEALEKRIAELEHQLVYCNEENDAIREKYERIIESRDSQIKTLQTQVRSAEFSRDDAAFHTIDLDEKTFLSAKSSSSATSSASIEERIAQEIAALKEKHEAEISALMSVHSDNIFHIRQEYEQKIQELQNWGSTDISFNEDEKSAVHDNEISELKNALDAVHDENRKTIAELRAQLLEKESELQRLHSAKPAASDEEVLSSESGGKRTHDDDEKRPPSITESSGSNNGWERMGTEYLSGTVGATSSSSSDGEGHARRDLDDRLKQSNEDHERLEFLENELSSYKEQVKSLAVMNEKLQSDMETVHQELDILQTEQSEDSERIKELTDENERLQKSLVEANEAAHDKINSIMAEKSECLARIQELMAANADLRESSQRSEEVNKEILSYKNQIELIKEAKQKLEAEAEQLRSEIDALLGQKATDAKRIEELSSDNERLTESLRSSAELVQKELLAYKNQAESTAKQNEKLHAEIGQLRSEISTSAAQNTAGGSEKLQSEIQAMRQEVNTLQAERSNDAARIKELIGENELLRETLAEADRTLNGTIQQMRDEINSVMAENSSYLARIEELSSANTQLRESSHKSEEADEQILLYENRIKQVEEAKKEVEQQLQSEIDALLGEKAVDAKRVEELSSENERLLESLRSSEGVQKELLAYKSQTTSATEHSNRLQEEVEKLHEEVIVLANQRSVDAAQIEELNLENGKLRSSIDALRDNCEKSNSYKEQLEKSREEQEHLRKELTRLREHLLNMEDVSTKEAILAEERETQLREEIRALQSRTQQFSESANQSQNQYQDEITMLKEQLVASEENSAKLRQLLSEKEISHTEISQALVNLQQVLRELSDDQSQEVRSYENQLRVLRNENEEMRTLVKSLREQESSLLEDRRFSEDSVALLKEELERKNATIEQLENQIEDLRYKKYSARNTTQSEQGELRADGGAERKSSGATYKIDDATLKNLFYSYFLAEKEKQPEIAMVMASILGYSKEQQEAIHEAMSANFGGGSGWFFGLGGGGGGPRRSRQQGPSLTEQFIRFLESESRALAEQPTLHIQSDSTFAPQPGILLNEVSLPVPATESVSRSTYSSSDLKSILDQP